MGRTPWVSSLAGMLLLGATVTARQAPTAHDDRPQTLRLRDAVAQALEHGPALRQPTSTAASAAVQLRLVSSRYDFRIQPQLAAGTDAAGNPQRTFGLGVSRKLSFGTELQASANAWQLGSEAAPYRDAGYSFGLSQPFGRGLGGAASIELDAARRAVAGADRGLAESRQQLVLTVAQAYFSLLRAQLLVDSSERALERARQLRRASEARAEVGLSTELDVLRADLLAAQAEASLGDQRGALADAEDQLRLVTGAPLDGPPLRIPIDALGEAELSVGPATLEQALTTALASRLELRDAADQIEQARRVVGAARWNRMPQVTFNLSYNRRGFGPAANPLFSQTLNGWRYGITTTYGADRAESLAAVQTADLTLRAAELRAGDVGNGIVAEVRRAFRTVSSADQALTLQDKTVALAERQRRLAEIRFERGIADNFDLIDAENNVLQAQAGLANAKVARALAVLALRRACGTLSPEIFLK